MLIYLPYKLHVLRRLYIQEVSQLRFLKEPYSNSACNDLLVASSSLDIQLLVQVYVGSDSLPTSHLHRQ